MSVRSNFRDGLRIGALVVFAFVFLLSIATTATLGYVTPDPYGVVWLSISAYLALFVGLAYAFRPWGPAYP